MIKEIDLHLTNRCNLACEHCSVLAGRTHYDEMPLESWVEIVDQAAALGCNYFDFTGGEPALYPDIFALVRYISSLGKHLEMQSNGLLLTNTILVDLWKSGLRNLVVSLDGPPATHEHVRGISGAFARTTEAIRHSVEIGYSVRVAMCIVDEQQIGDIRGFTDCLTELHISHLSVNRFSPVAASHFAQYQPEDPANWLAFTEKLEQLSRETHYPITYAALYTPANQIEECLDEATACLVKRRSWFLIRADGEIYPCYHFVHCADMSLGNIESGCLSRIIAVDNPNWIAYEDVLAVPVECRDCKLVSSCGGGCRSAGHLQGMGLRTRDHRCAVETGFIPLCPFVKRTAGTEFMTNISPYYIGGHGRR